MYKAHTETSRSDSPSAGELHPYKQRSSTLRQEEECVQATQDTEFPTQAGISSIRLLLHMGRVLASSPT